ncbi:MAG TPA: class I SAM-dependent methyltransferase [Solirubrobacteraceae bacterium]|nr:class I SAM-dependent methyltransferase [Solirubrobacteraceae bacterium]
MTVASSPMATRTIAACPFCSGQLRPRYRDIGDRLRTVSEMFSVDECAVCGAGVLNPSPTGDVSVLYPANYLSGEEEADGAPGTPGLDLERRYRYNQYRFDFELLTRATGAEIGASPSYVDLGCGSGERVAFVAECGCPRSVGVDKFDFAKSAAQRRAAFVNSELTDFRPAERFRVASLFHVLEHLEHPGEVLDHIRDHVLEPGGHVVVQVPNYGALERRWFGARWFGLDVPRHLWHFNPDAIRRFMDDHGYDVIGLYERNAPLHPVTIVPSLFRGVDVQRIWTDRSHGSAYKRAMQLLWAGLTVLSVPICVLENLLGKASLLTVVARPR